LICKMFNIFKDRHTSNLAWVDHFKRQTATRKPSLPL
jgi:hypothetical protein